MELEAMEQEAIPIDLFAADVYNLGKTLEGELCAAFKVNIASDPLFH